MLLIICNIFQYLIESTTNHTPIYPDCEQTGMNSLELATVYLAPKVLPPPPAKSLLIETPPGWHPPILADGTHSSFLHIIMHVRLAGFHARSLTAPLPK
jgi:hypothetical protein